MAISSARWRLVPLIVAALVLTLGISLTACSDSSEGDPPSAEAVAPAQTAIAVVSSALDTPASPAEVAPLVAAVPEPAAAPFASAIPNFFPPPAETTSMVPTPTGP